jgi:hypothetical protein
LDNIIEKKFKIALDEHYKQQQKTKSVSINNKNNSLNKTELYPLNFTEDLVKYEKKQMSNCTINDQEIGVTQTQIIGNVARKIINIEKNIHNKR